MPSDVKVANYAAAFVDILGQRDALRGCGLIPSSKEELLALVKESIGAISRLHCWFDKFYGESQRPPNSNLVRPDQREEFIRQQKTELKYQRFSDGLVGYVSLATDVSVPMNGVYALIGAAGSLCFISLAARQPIRGGIEIAWGAELNENELYGCVVAKSYELESRVARYPRIALGSELVRYLDQHERVPGDDPESEYVRQLSTICKELIIVYDDGVPSVHYLGQGFRNYVSCDQHPALHRDAAQFVAAQLARWTERGDEKLAGRYRELHAYFERYPPF